MKKSLNKLISFLGVSSDYSYNINLPKVVGMILHQGMQYSSGGSSRNSSTILDYANLLTILPVSEIDKQKDLDESFNARLIGQVREKTTEFSDVLKPDGSNLAQYLFSLKNSPKSSDRTKFSKIQREFRNMFNSDSLDFDVLLQYEDNSTRNGLDDPKPKKLGMPFIMIVDSTLEREFSLNQVGSGISEVIYLLTLAYGVNNSVVLLDEPSVNLHPSLMQALSKSLQSSDSSNQFIIITHSPELVHHEVFETKSDILYLRKLNRSTIVKKLDEETQTWFEKTRPILKHQLYPGVFFAKSVILVEGDSDKNILTGIANSYNSAQSGINIIRDDVIIVQVNGYPNFKNFVKLFDSLPIQYVILADCDAKQYLTKMGVAISGFVTADGIKTNDVAVDGVPSSSSNAQVLVIENGDLEQLLKDIDSNVYSSAKTEARQLTRDYKQSKDPSKSIVAQCFVDKVMLTNPDKLKSFTEILQIGVKLSHKSTS